VVGGFCNGAWMALNDRVSMRGPVWLFHQLTPSFCWETVR